MGGGAHGDTKLWFAPLYESWEFILNGMRHMIRFNKNSLCSMRRITFKSDDCCLFIPMILCLMRNMRNNPPTPTPPTHTHIIHSWKSPQEKDTTLSKILGSMTEKNKQFSTGIFFAYYNSMKTIWHKMILHPGSKIWNRSTDGAQIPKQAVKGEILLKCKFCEGFVPEACRVKLAFKHIGILMSWGASTFNPFRITVSLHCNWLLVQWQCIHLHQKELDISVL